MDKSRADFEAGIAAKLTINFNGKDVPQQWFTRKEVIALLSDCAQASRKQALEDSYSHAYRLGDALRELLSDTQHAEHPPCDDDGWCPVRDAREALEEFDAHLAAIRSLEGNATKETTCSSS